jgi:hypothetical protein
MLQKVKDKILGWWLCLAGKFSKKDHETQFAVYAVLLIFPILFLYIFDFPINIWVFFYYLMIYLFFQIGFLMVKK